MKQLNNLYVYNCKVEFEDIDLYGILYHPALIKFLDRAKVEFLFKNNIDMGTAPYALVVRNLTVKFIKQLKLGSNLKIEMNSQSISAYTFTLEYKTFESNILCAKANLEFALITRKTNELIKVPTELLLVLEKIKRECD